MTRRSLATLLFVGLAFLAQLSAVVFHTPHDLVSSAESATLEIEAEHEEEVVSEESADSAGLPVRRWRSDERVPNPAVRADEILHVPRS